MKPIIAFNTISEQFCKHGNELMKLEFDINAGAAAIVYVQVFDFPTPVDLAAGNTAPADTSVPLKSWPVPAGAQDNYKEFKNGEMTFSYGCFVCVSTTQATLTIGTGNNKFDSVAAELTNPIVVGTTEVNAQGVDILQVWAEAAGPKKLLRAVVTSLVGTSVSYAKIFSQDNPLASPNVPIVEVVMQKAGDSAGRDTVELNFGSSTNGFVSGMDVQTLTSQEVPKVGCTIFGSTIPGTNNRDGTYNIYAEYI